MRKILKSLDLLSLRVQITYTCLVVYVLSFIFKWDSQIAGNVLLGTFGFFVASRTAQNHIETRSKILMNNNNNDLNQED